jgi:hypothetical protein
MPSVEITPGYDFGLTEIPTKNKFLQAALGIDIGKIQFEDVDVSLVASYGGEVSGSTGASLPGEGYLWTDPAGNTWIETVDGPVRLNRNDGGWESMRWHNNTRLVGQDDARGFGVELEGAGGSENSMRFRTIMRSVVGGSGYIVGIATNTASSGPERIVGKGIVEMYGGFGFATGSNFWKLLFASNAPAAQYVTTDGADAAAYWVHYGYDSAGLPLTAGKEWYHGMLLGPDSGTSHWSDGASGVEVGEAYMLCYFYGSDTPLKV